MVRRFSTVVAGVWLIVLGVGRWLDSRAVSKTVDTYMTAVIAGDSETVLSLLVPDQRALVEQRVAKQADNDFWAPQVGTKFRIHHVDISGTQATAQLWIE